MQQLPEAVLIHMQSPYDPAKRRAYYLKTRQLKGRQTGTQDVPDTSQGTVVPIKKAVRVSAANQASSEARISAIKDRLATLRDALQKALAEKTSSSSTSSTTSKSDTSTTKPSTATEKAAAKKSSQKYRDTHKQEIAAKQKAISDMSVDELRAAIQQTVAKLRAAVQQARTQTASNGR